MKKSKFTLTVLFVTLIVVCFVASGCDLLFDTHSHVWGDDFLKNDNYHWQKCTLCSRTTTKVQHEYGEWSVEIEATETTSGLRVRECEVCEYRDEETIPPNSTTQATGTVDFYAINDFHGEYDRLAQVSGFIYDKIDNSNTVAINSGDMFQGSMQSNWNYGSLFAECMDMAGFDAFTYGNHEFDWGLDNLRSLAANSAAPYLGANIYNWNAGTWGTFAADLAKEYVIKDLDNGLRVGIIGIIGKDQITSISSQLVQTIGFKDPKEVVPALSNKLREDLQCDVVVVSAHTGPETFLNDYSWDITKYADAVFCAHTHRAETEYKNGVPFIQGGSYGGYVSHVQLVVDDNGNVRCDGYSNISYNNLNGINTTVKNQVQTKINNSNAQIANEANEVLTTLAGSLDSDVGVPRLVAHAIADYATSQGYNIALAMVNNARSPLSVSSVTYSALYEAIPFDNVVYVARVSGRDLINEAGYSTNSFWRVTEDAIQNSSSTYYYVAVIDYLLYHQNTNREYNFFKSAFTSGFEPVALTKNGFEVYNYRLLTRDFLRKQDSVAATTYTLTNDFTNFDKLTQAVDLSGGAIGPTEPVHEGTLSDPYSVTDAILLASGYSSASGAPSGFVKGTVCDVRSAKLSSTSGDIYNVYVTDESGNRFLLYYIKKFQGATSSNNWISASELQVGDELVFFAQTMYSYNGTPEAYNGYVVSINGVETK